MKNNLFRTLILSVIMIMGITSVCFADIMILPGERLAWKLERLMPLFLMILVVGVIEYISFYLLEKNSKDNENKKENYIKRKEVSKYHILLALTLMTTPIWLIGIFSLIWAFRSLITATVGKDTTKAYTMLKKYLIVIVSIIALLYVWIFIEIHFF